MIPRIGEHEEGLPTHIVLDHMPQQINARGPEDDWTGKSDRLERKKRQNRINQREHRKRKEAQARQEISYAHSNAGSMCKKTPRKPHESIRKQAIPVTQDMGPWQLFCSAISCTNPQISKLAQVAVIMKSETGKPDMMLRQFQKWVTRNYTAGSPSSDHVLVLIKFNIFRAVIEIAGILGLGVESALEEDSLSPFAPGSSLEKYIAGHRPIMELPPSLRPTPIQCHIPHHPWIDLLPIPRMRDNLILAEDTYDDYDLCEDLCGFFNRVETRSGLIIWGSPWDPDGWEFTPYFLKKWSWILVGCDDLMLATNRWRQRRGEMPMNFAALGLLEA